MTELDILKDGFASVRQASRGRCRADQNSTSERLSTQGTYKWKTVGIVNTFIVEIHKMIFLTFPTQRSGSVESTSCWRFTFIRFTATAITIRTQQETILFLFVFESVEIIPCFNTTINTNSTSWTFLALQNRIWQVLQNNPRFTDDFCINF